MKSQKLDLILPEYEKIFQILQGLFLYENKGRPPSCQFFNVVGALILSEVYRLQARPVIGAAFIKIEEESGYTLAFADKNYEVCNSNKDGFHCWIETPSYYIDFTAPLYSEYPNSKILPKLMFQKPRSTMSGSHFELNKPGDFYFKPNAELTNYYLANMLKSDKFRDFADIAVEWAKRSINRMVKEMKIQADDGEIIDLIASSVSITGKW